MAQKTGVATHRSGAVMRQEREERSSAMSRSRGSFRTGQDSRCGDICLHGFVGCAAMAKDSKDRLYQPEQHFRADLEFIRDGFDEGGADTSRVTEAVSDCTVVSRLPQLPLSAPNFDPPRAARLGRVFSGRRRSRSVTVIRMLTVQRSTSRGAEGHTEGRDWRRQNGQGVCRACIKMKPCQRHRQ